MRLLLSLLTFFVTVPGVVAAPGDKLPSYDIQRNCSSEASSSGNVKDTKAGCVQDEDDAKKQLAQRWSKLQASDAKRRCLEGSSIGGDQSYVELLTCLEMSTDWTHDQTSVGQASSKNQRR